MTIANKMASANNKIIVILTKEQLSKVFRVGSYYKTQPDELDEDFMKVAPTTYKEVKSIYDTFNNSDFYPIFGFAYYVNNKSDYRERIKQILYKSKTILSKYNEEDLYIVKIAIDFSLTNYLNYDNVLLHVKTDGQIKPYKRYEKLNYLDGNKINSGLSKSDLYMLPKILKDDIITYEKVTEWRLSNKVNLL